jgi:exonuclease III
MLGQNSRWPSSLVHCELYSCFILQTLDVKKEWNLHFTKYIRDLEKEKPVIWTGDVNVAPTELG